MTIFLAIIKATILGKWNKFIIKVKQVKNEKNVLASYYIKHKLKKYEIQLFYLNVWITLWKN